MPKPKLLPGVSSAACPPRVVCDAHTAIRRARRGAIARDVMQVALIMAVDYLFAHWPDTRIPFLDRGQSLTLVRCINAVVITDLMLSRALPRWSAWRISATWCRSERERFRT